MPEGRCLPFRAKGSRGVIAFHEKGGSESSGFCGFFVGQVFLPAETLSPPFDPHSQRAILFSLGASWVFSFRPVLPSFCRPRLPSSRRKWARRLTQSPKLGFVAFLFFLPENVLTLCSAGIVIGWPFRSDSYTSPLTHKRCSNTASFQAVAITARFLPFFRRALRQLQPPAPQITIRSKPSQNVVRSLHQQRAQIRIAFLADVHLRFALPRVSPS
jgi:hypothetical protein